MTTISCKSHIKNYCSTCSFAGVRFIADDTKHWTERWLWIALVALSWYGSALLIIAAWNAFVTNPISFGVETTYTDWDTRLPTVAICELSNDDKIYNVSDTIWTPKHLLDLEDVLKDIAYFRGVAYSLLEVCYTKKMYDPRCPLSNYSYYAQLIRSSCHEILKNCSYNDKEFNCCEYFQPIETDIGVCYIINSIQTKRQVTVRNIEDDPLVIKTTPQQRACRYHDENDGGLYPHYSYSACNVFCRKRAQMELCQCNDHFMLGTTESERCNISGMWCLHTHSSHLTTLKPAWAKRPGLSCDCMPSCDETEVTVIKDVITSLKPKKKKTYVELMLAYLPTERFKRNVVRSQLDLVVSVGGTAGLFVGASLLSFVELIFFFTIRFISDLCMKIHEREQIIPIYQN
ncbi:sodium channel protein Nach-like [Nymphalis io]|uniref:sodium channel protein Nach-like n=1 Tax=Inachis io TaxID=171585 RepID=UPI0021675684|nr:sodium channel protein Nach-like [Nymphalis io]